MLAVLTHLLACNPLNGLLVSKRTNDKNEETLSLINHNNTVLANGIVIGSNIRPPYMGSSGWIAGPITNACRCEVDAVDRTVTMRIMFHETEYSYHSVVFIVPQAILRENTLAYLKSNVRISCENMSGPPGIIVKYLNGYIPPHWITLPMKDNPHALYIIAALRTIKMPDDVRGFIIGYLLA